MKKNQLGFSMVELMVGCVISLLITLTVAGSAQFLNTQKRITVGTNSVLENIAISYRSLSTNLKLNGYGLYSCPSTTAIVGGKTIHVGYPAISADIESPLQIYITNNDAGNDSITSFSGDSATGIAYSILTSNFTGTITTGFASQLTPSGLALISDTLKCDVYAVKTSTFDSASKTTTVTLNNTFNGASWTSSGNTYAQGSMVLGLTDLKLVTHSVVNNFLQEYDAITDKTVKVANNIVYFKAYYGLKDGTFVKADSSSGTDYSPSGIAATENSLTKTSVKIRSLRIFIVSRSPVLNEKNKDTGLCDATSNANKVIASWKGYNADGSLNTALDGPTFDVTTLTDGQCYKYTKSDFIIPLRNKVLNEASSGV